jgi:hypothetical protein
MKGRQARKIISAVLVLVLVFSVLPITASAESSSDYMRVTKNDSYTKNSIFNMSYDVTNVTNYYLSVIGQYIDPSGKVMKTFNTLIVNVGESGSWSFPFNFSGYSGGQYAFKLTVCVGNGDLGLNWAWTTKITHSVPEPSISFDSYETYYNNNGVLIHKLSVDFKNLKGQRIYLKIYDENGYLVGNWGNDETTPQKSNNGTAYFTWTAGWSSGNPFPSGYYTFVFSNSANNKTISETLWLMIPQKGVG